MTKFPYTKYSFFYPPRPKNAIPYESIKDYDNKSFISQAKLNGSNVFIAFNHEQVHVMNRHGERMTRFQIDKEEILNLHRGEVGNWIVINGEYMNKSQNDKNGKVFNHKLVIFDILVYDNIHLIGNTFDQRIRLLDNLYGQIECEDEFLYNVSENIYRVKSFLGGGFDELFSKLIKIGMYEGLVIKRKRAKLENGTNVSNNSNSQVKCRKKTRNYSF